MWNSFLIFIGDGIQRKHPIKDDLYIWFQVGGNLSELVQVGLCCIKLVRFAHLSGRRSRRASRLFSLLGIWNRTSFCIWLTWLMDALPIGKTYQFFLPIENKELTKIVSLTGNDLETSELLYSAMFCINQKNAFLICKSCVFLLHCQSYSSEK